MRIETPCTFAITASCGQGKSYFIKSMLYQLRSAHRRYSECSDEVINTILESQAADLKARKLQPMFIIFDDCLAKFNGKSLTRLFTQYRHYQISIFSAAQHYAMLSPAIRQNTRYIVTFKMNNKKAIKAIYEEYLAGDFGSLSEASAFLRKKTEGKYAHILIDKDAPTEHKFAAGKAPAFPDYRFEF